MTKVYQSGSHKHQSKGNYSLSSDRTTSPQPSANDNILQLQQTLGNQAVMQMMRQGDIAQAKPTSSLFNPSAFSMASGQTTKNQTIQRLSVNGTKWKKADNASKGAAEGVNLVFNIGSKGEDIVIKGLKSDGAQMQFASQVYEEMVEAPKTRIVQTASAEGAQIVTTLEKLIKKKKVTNITDATLTKLKSLPVLMLMEKKDLSTIERFSKELQPDQTKATGNAGAVALITKMFQGSFFIDLGRIHAADIFLGNHDRLDPGMGMTQIQNIFIDIVSGRALGMDLDVQASNFESVKNGNLNIGKKKTQAQFKTIDANAYKDWVQFAIDGSLAQRDVENKETGAIKQQEFGVHVNGKGMGTANVAHLANDNTINTIIDNLKTKMVAGFNVTPNDPDAQQRIEMLTGGNDPALQQQANAKWATAKQQFKLGITQGLVHMAEKMESGVYKQYFDKATADHGQDAAFDYKVLQIRHMYLKAKKEYTWLTEAQIRTRLEMYAQFLQTGAGVNPFEGIAPPRPNQALPPVRGRKNAVSKGT